MVPDRRWHRSAGTVAARDATTDGGDAPAALDRDGRGRADRTVLAWSVRHLRSRPARRHRRVDRGRAGARGRRRARGPGAVRRRRARRAVGAPDRRRGDRRSSRDARARRRAGRCDRPLPGLQRATDGAGRRLELRGRARIAGRREGDADRIRRVVRAIGQGQLSERRLPARGPSDRRRRAGGSHSWCRRCRARAEPWMRRSSSCAASSASPTCSGPTGRPGWPPSASARRRSPACARSSVRDRRP